MLVRLTFGARAGEVVDFLPHEARAMLSDGRGLPVGTPAVPLVPHEPVASVHTRTDRVPAHVPPRRRR
jgi:hypothetical protein